MMDLVSFTLKRNLRINMRRKRLFEKMTETLAHCTPLTAQQELCNEYQHDRVKVVFIIFCCFVHWTKVLFI